MRVKTAFYVISLGMLLQSTCSAAYTFTFDGDGNSWEIGFTDGLGGRLGMPLFSGVLPVGFSVTRTTNNATVEDHYAVQIKPLKVSSADFFFSGATALANVVAPTTFLPVLSSDDPALSIYAAVDVTKWIAGGGVFAPGRVYSGFTNGTNPLLPGFTVGFATTPIDFTTAFNLNTLTGAVTFNQAQPFTSSQGSLVTDTRMIAAVPEPSSWVTIIAGFAALLGYGCRRAKLPIPVLRFWVSV